MNDIGRWLDTWGAYVGIAALIIFMGMIIRDLAKNSNAGKFGTIILFTTLGMGMFGFVIKGVIYMSMNSYGA